MPKGQKRVRKNEREHGAGSIKELAGGKVRAWRSPQPHPADPSKTYRPSKLFKGQDARDKAEAWLAGVQPSPAMPLGQWLELWVTRRQASLRPNTLRNYKLFVAWLGPIKLRPLDSLTADDWQVLIDVLLKDHARSSIKAARSIWSGALGAAVRAGHITTNPLRDTRLPREEEKIPPAWRRDEVQRLLAACRGHCHEMFIHLALATGLRLSELRALTWADVDLRARTVTVSKAMDNQSQVVGPTKSGRIRVVDLPAETGELLAAHIKRQPPGQQLVLGHDGRAYTAHTYREVLVALCSAAKVTPLHPHALRHTFASLAIDAGVSLPELADALGHANARITGEIYTHFVERLRRRTARAVGSVLYGPPEEQKPHLHTDLHSNDAATR